MRKFVWFILFNLLLCSISYAANTVYILNLQTPIGPAAQNYITRGLETANEQKASLVIINLNTPGGFEKPTRTIIENIIASPVPVVAYISPTGAHAANGGTSILYASHIAAMAPGTDVGPAAMKIPTKNYFSFIYQIKENSVDDAAAKLRSLAELNHRNASWAEESVHNNTSLTAEQALEKNVINFMATNTDELLTKLNGYKLAINHVPLVLHTQNAVIQTIVPDWRYHLLRVITNPTIVYLLLIIGIFGVFYEYLKPGKVLPGLVGSICLLTAFYAYQLLSLNFFGLTLFLIGIACMIMEISIASFGILATCGIIAFMGGSILLLKTNTPGYHLTWAITLLLSLACTALLFLLLSFTIKSYKPAAPGGERVVGKIGEVLEFHAEYVMVRVGNQIWSAQSKQHLDMGQKVRVTKISNFILTVEPIVSLGE